MIVKTGCGTDGSFYSTNLVPGLPDLRRAAPPPDGAAQRAQAAAGLPSRAHVAVVEAGVAQQLLQHAVGEVLNGGHGQTSEIRLSMNFKLEFLCFYAADVIHHIILTLIEYELDLCYCPSPPMFPALHTS